MNEIKPTLRIAQEISGRHTVICLKIMVPLILSSIILPIIALKILGYSHPGIILKSFYDRHQKIITSTILFIHFFPVNFYAITRLFYLDFKKFQLKLVPPL